jgi:hypothetical protein
VKNIFEPSDIESDIQYFQIKADEYRTNYELHMEKAKVNFDAMLRTQRQQQLLLDALVIYRLYKK